MEENMPPSSMPPPLRQAHVKHPNRNWLWVILGLGLVGVIGLFVVSLVVYGLSGFQVQTGMMSQGVPPLQEVTVEYNRTRNKIALIDVSGLITGQTWDGYGRSMVTLIADQLKAAAKDDSVEAVILKVDSPGGEVLASDEIATAIRRFQEASGKPVVASMGSLAASGGYYVSAPCRWIVANELTITGSIGVIMQSLNYRGLFDKVGLHPFVFKSGEFKDMLSGLKQPSEMDPREREMIQAMVNDTFEKFKSVVSQGRSSAAEANQGAGRALAPNWAEYADGRVLTGKQAHELGFVDELGDFRTAVNRAKDLAGVSEANLIRYRQPFGLTDVFSIFGQSESKSIKLDLGVNLPKLEAGRPYFLSSSFVY